MTDIPAAVYSWGLIQSLHRIYGSAAAAAAAATTTTTAGTAPPADLARFVSQLSSMGKPLTIALLTLKTFHCFLLSSTYLSMCFISGCICYTASSIHDTQ